LSSSRKTRKSRDEIRRIPPIEPNRFSHGSERSAARDEELRFPSRTKKTGGFLPVDFFRHAQGGLQRGFYFELYLVVADIPFEHKVATKSKDHPGRLHA